MASNSSSSARPPTKRSGKRTEEYKRVNEHMSVIISAIEVNPGATGRLITEFMTQKWLAAHLDPKEITTMQLIQLALNRIENDASDYEVFLQMLEDITVTGLNQILPKVSTREESTHRESKESMVSGNMYRRSVHPPKRQDEATGVHPDLGYGKKKAAWMEPDSGYHGKEKPSQTDPDSVEPPPCPASPTPGTIPNRLEVASGFVPENSPQDNNVSPNGAVGFRVPSSAKSVNTKAQQPRLDAVEHHSSIFVVGSGAEICAENESMDVDQEESMFDEPGTASKPVQEISESEKETVSEAAVYSSRPGVINQLKEQRQQIQDLKQKLKDEKEANKEAIKERDQLKDSLEKLQEYTDKVILEKNRELEEKVREVEGEKEKMKSDHRKVLAEAEREKREMESEHKVTVAKLEEKISKLRKEIDEQKKESEIKTLQLEKQIKENEITILRQENKISEFDKKIQLASKDAEIQELHEKMRNMSSLAKPKPHPPHFKFTD